jgi:hypothetical protein
MYHNDTNKDVRRMAGKRAKGTGQKAERVHPMPWIQRLLCASGAYVCDSSIHSFLPSSLFFRMLYIVQSLITW